MKMYFNARMDHKINVEMYFDARMDHKMNIEMYFNARMDHKMNVEMYFDARMDHKMNVEMYFDAHMDHKMNVKMYFERCELNTTSDVESLTSEIGEVPITRALLVDESMAQYAILRKSNRHFRND